MKWGALCPSFCLALLLSGCSHKINPKYRGIGYKEQIVYTDIFPLYTMFKFEEKKNKKVRIYIEGDGNAWINRTTPSTNPTPKNKMLLKMVLDDPRKNIIYIARPCQYIQNETACRQEYWTNKRYSREVITGIDSVINYYVKRYHIEKIELVGYSGGATIASVIAATRNDIKKLITIAGNLDHKAWCEVNNLTPLIGSENLFTYKEKLKNIEQIHFYGSKDKIVPKEVIFAYKNMIKSNKAVFIEVSNQGHAKWNTRWEYLNRKYL